MNRSPSSENIQKLWRVAFAVEVATYRLRAARDGGRFENATDTLQNFIPVRATVSRKRGEQCENHVSHGLATSPRLTSGTTFAATVYRPKIPIAATKAGHNFRLPGSHTARVI